MQDPPTDSSAAAIYFEVALIRDAYHARKPDVGEFMDHLVRIVAHQESIADYRAFTQLPDLLRDPTRTHPRQIRQKSKEEGIALTEAESRLYGAIQGMFNAKPDLAITLPGVVIAYEAKYTQAFGREQTSRTERVVQVWRTLLYEDLGFTSPPNALTVSIGPQSVAPDITWEWLLERASQTYPPADRTRCAIESAVRFVRAHPAG